VVTIEKQIYFFKDNEEYKDFEKSEELKINTKKCLNKKDILCYLTNIITGNVKEYRILGSGKTTKTCASINDKLKAIDLINKIKGYYKNNVKEEKSFGRLEIINNLEKTND